MAEEYSPLMGKQIGNKKPREALAHQPKSVQSLAPPGKRSRRDSAERCPETCVGDRATLHLLGHPSSNAHGAHSHCAPRENQSSRALLWHFILPGETECSSLNRKLVSFRKVRRALGEEIKQAGETERDQVWSRKPSLRR